MNNKSHPTIPFMLIGWIVALTSFYIPYFITQNIILSGIIGMTISIVVCLVIVKVYDEIVYKRDKK